MGFARRQGHADVVHVTSCNLPTYIHHRRFLNALFSVAGSALAVSGCVLPLPYVLTKVSRAPSAPQVFHRRLRPTLPVSRLTWSKCGTATEMTVR